MLQNSREVSVYEHLRILCVRTSVAYSSEGCDTSYPAMNSPIHGEHNVASCNSVYHYVCNLQLFL